jgi:hypothetical protein
MKLSGPVGSLYRRIVPLGDIARLTTSEGRTELLRKSLYVMAASALLALLCGTAIAQTNTAQPVDPPQQVAELREQYEGLTPQQIEARGYVPEGSCVINPQGPGAMGIHALNQELLQAQFPKGKMDPENPPVLLLDENSNVIGLEWEAADVGQGPMKMFGQTIELQPGHPGVPEPHYMLHIYFKPDGKVLFGTDPQTAFDPEGACPPMSATASATSTATASASASATASATATSTATATGSASALVDTGGAFSLTLLAPLALLVTVGTGVLAIRVMRSS